MDKPASNRIRILSRNSKYIVNVSGLTVVHSHQAMMKLEKSSSAVLTQNQTSPIIQPRTLR